MAAVERAEKAPPPLGEPLAPRREPRRQTRTKRPPGFCSRMSAEDAETAETLVMREGVLSNDELLLLVSQGDEQRKATQHKATHKLGILQEGTSEEDSRPEIPMHPLFAAMDKNRSGTVERDEYFAHVLPTGVRQAEAMAAWHVLDPEGTGVIDWKQFDAVVHSDDSTVVRKQLEDATSFRAGPTRERLQAHRVFQWHRSRPEFADLRYEQADSLAGDVVIVAFSPVDAFEGRHVTITGRSATLTRAGGPGSEVIRLAPGSALECAGTIVEVGFRMSGVWALYTVQYSTVQYSAVQCSAVRCITIYHTPLHSTPIHSTPLHSTALHCTTAVLP